MKIKLIQLIDADLETQLLVRDIRNEDNVRKWMYTDHKISSNEHLDWVNRVKFDTNQEVFIVVSDNKPLGVVSINAIDSKHGKADWAYYLTESARGGLGAAIEYTIIDFAFSNKNIEKLNCEVIEGNDAVIKLHKKFAFEDEGFRKSNIVKDGKRLGVHFLGLAKSSWEEKKKDIREKYSSIFDKFDIEICWNNPGSRESNPIDDIQAAMARNNLNWMSILRLALEKSPQTATPIIADIKKLDREILNLTNKLAPDEENNTEMQLSTQFLNKADKEMEGK